jgi:hypothetical protein
LCNCRGVDSKSQLIGVLIIDAQEDFCDWSRNSGAIPVPGSHTVFKRIASMISHNMDAIGDIFVTLQSHHVRYSRGFFIIFKMFMG